MIDPPASSKTTSALALGAMPTAFHTAGSIATPDCCMGTATNTVPPLASAAVTSA